MVAKAASLRNGTVVPDALMHVSGVWQLNKIREHAEATNRSLNRALDKVANRCVSVELTTAVDRACIPVYAAPSYTANGPHCSAETFTVQIACITVKVVGSEEFEPAGQTAHP